MKTLYIIGNGFDRAHNLPTDYRKNLREILKTKDEELFEFVDKLFFSNNIDYWSDFESKVGSVESSFANKWSEKSTEVIQSFNSEYSDPSPSGFASNPDDERFGDYYTEVDNAIFEASNNKPNLEDICPFLDELENISDFLSDGMDLMVEEAEEKIESLNPIGTFSSDSYFISFNYTTVLERLYNIKENRVLHIHGTNDKIWGNEQDNIDTDGILSIDFHNYDIEDYPIEDSYPSNLAEFRETIIYSYDEVKDIENQIDQVFSDTNSRLVKKLEIDKFRKFVCGVGAIDQIVILGHSLGKVDSGYFELLNELCPEVIWYVSFYNSDDIVRKNADALSFGKKLRFKSFTELFLLGDKNDR